MHRRCSGRRPATGRLPRRTDKQHINVGTGEDVTISDFATLVAQTVGYEGRIDFDATRPDGMPRKLLDVSRLAALGWRARTPLAEGLKRAYLVFCRNGVGSPEQGRMPAGVN